MSLKKFIQKIIIESFKNDLNEEIKIPIEIGDTVLGGKFKNKKIKVKTIDKNEKGDITINGKPLMRFRIIKENSQDNLADYKKWKRKNVTIRGVSNTPEEYNGVGSISLGDGFYTAHLGNREMARKYGKVYFVVNGRPKNPLVFDSINRAEIWLQQNLYFKNYKSMRDFNAHTSIEKEVQKLGYDGIEIKGREMVNFKPRDIKFFPTERGLIDYYYDFVKPNQTT